MDDALFLSFCAIVLFIFGGIIFAEFGYADGLAVIAIGLIAAGGAGYAARKPRKITLQGSS